ncbi:MAG: nucleoside triphosphate pyrophosphatase [Woeseia sp.]
MPADLHKPDLHLASASPRRREILTALGLRFSYAGSDVDEVRAGGESAADMVMRLASAKAQAACADRPGCAIIAADTAVVLGDRVFGKPLSKADGLTMLAALSGRTHEVITGVVVLHAGREQKAMSRSLVTFRTITAAEAAAYWHSGEPQDKAGGYAIQGLAAVFVRDLHGSHSGVIGLPICETAALLGNIGIHVLPQA